MLARGVAEASGTGAVFTIAGPNSTATRVYVCVCVYIYIFIYLQRGYIGSLLKDYWLSVRLCK